jgi:RecJ-like exonuclease
MKVKIFTHGDTDGICAASLITARYPDAEAWITHPVGLLKDLKDCDADLVFICDIAISEKDKEELFEEFSKIASKGRLIYIDHHPLPIGIMSGDLPCTRVIRDVTKSSSELTYRLFEREIDKEMDRVALFGAISDYCDETDYVHEELDFYDKRTIYMESGLLSQCLGESKGDYEFKREVIKKLAKLRMPSEISEVVKRALAAIKKEWRLYEYVQKNVEIVEGIAVVRDLSKGFSPTKAAKFAIGVTGSPMGLSTISRDNHVDISVRKKEDFPLDLNLALRTIAVRFQGSGGGHPSAAGARVPTHRLNEFIKTLAKETSSVI